MGNIMKVGGKSPNNTAVGMSVDSNGIVNSHHVWEGGITKIFDEVMSGVTVIRMSDLLDISEYSLISLRIYNKTGTPFTLIIYSDIPDHTGSYMSTIDGDVQLQINSKNRIQAVTPDDIPCLPYMNSLQCGVRFDTATESDDHVKIYVVYKR